jgi:hypothetical protein
MSAESIIRIIEDVRLEDGCTQTWEFISEGALPFYFCRKHQKRVPLSGPCPLSEFWARAGETVTVPAQVARRLVESELAEFPTHAPAKDEAVDSTLERVNALMKEQGLPPTDASALGVWKIQGRQENPYKRPAKPSDQRLAGDLGLSAEDIAEMRKAAGGSKP